MTPKISVYLLAGEYTAIGKASPLCSLSDIPTPTEAIMVGYVTLGTNDLKRAATFYDELAKELGVARMMEDERFIAWGKPGTGAGIGLTKPFDGKAATVGNGVMVALECASPADVDRVYAKALALGAKDEGKAGPRGGGFYAGYFRDPDGNKLNVFHISHG